ncbi:MAG: MarR family EPS-associated transcriptional regulator, partial [Halieaceae bacterium]|nr:MarR family EPS-associated transcriptional regulator [Halieaceae bacterium]
NLTNIDMVNEDDFRLLRLIESSPEISQREISKKSSLSLGKVNYCLKSLSEKGLIKIKRFSRSERKVGYIYVLTPKGLKTKSLMTIDFLRQKLAEYEALQDEIASLKNELEVTKAGEKQMDLTFDNGH